MVGSIEISSGCVCLHLSLITTHDRELCNQKGFQAYALFFKVFAYNTRGFSAFFYKVVEMNLSLEV